MPKISKNEIIVTALESDGYHLISLRVVPKRFLFSDGPCRSELEFSRVYFNATAVGILQELMREKILIAIKQHRGKRLYVDANGRIIPCVPGG